MYPEGWSDHWVSTGVCHVYFHVNQLDFSLHLLNNWSLATVSFSRAVKRGRDIPRWQRCVKSQRWCIDSKEWQQKLFPSWSSTSFFTFHYRRLLKSVIILLAWTGSAPQNASTFFLFDKSRDLAVDVTSVLQMVKRRGRIEAHGTRAIGLTAHPGKVG